MKTCPNCNHQADDGALFCTECGYAFQAPGTPGATSAPVQSYTPTQSASPAPYTDPYPQEEGAQAAPYSQMYAPPEKKKTKLPLIIGIVAAALVLVLVIGLVVRAFGGKKKASDDFVGIQRDFLEERLTGVTEAVGNDLKSVEVTFSATVDGRGEVADILTEVLDGSSYVVRAERKSDTLAAVNMILNLKGSNILEMLMSVDLDAREFAFSIPAADGNKYIMDFETYADIAGYTGVPQELLTIWTEDTTSLAADAEAIAKDVRDIVNRYADFFGSRITREMLEITNGKKIVLEELDEDVTATVMVWEPTAQELEDIFVALGEELENDDQLMNLADMMIQADDYYSSIYKDGEQFVLDLADNLIDNAPTMADTVVDSGFVWTLALDGKNDVCLISIETDNGAVIYERFADGKETAEVFYAKDDRNVLFSLLNEYTANGTKRTGKLSVNTDYGRVGIDYDIDTAKKSLLGLPYGTYTLDIRNLGLGLGITLSVADGGSSSTDHTLTVDGLGIFTDREVTEVSVTFNTKTPGKASEPEGREKDISGYDYWEFNELMEDLAMDLMESLMDSPEMKDILELIGPF